jgi:hypothetical protein
MRLTAPFDISQLQVDKLTKTPRDACELVRALLPQYRKSIENHTEQPYLNKVRNISLLEIG